MKRSETIGELAKALVKFNSKVSKVAKDAANPFFKNNYASLDQIIDEIRPILTEQGLSIMQFPSGDGSNVILTTYLMHESGEWIESEPLIMKPVKNDPQAVGSCITYARRYSLQSFLSLNTGEDDDGNQATGKQKEQKQQQNKGNNQQQQQQNKGNQQLKKMPPDMITEGQVKAVQVNLNNLSKSINASKEKLITRLEKELGDFGSVSGMSKGQASQAISLLKKWLETTGKQEGNNHENG